MEPRGIRNNNPLNIRRSGDKWQGLKTLQEDRDFFQFETIELGWRAAFVILCKTYYGKYKLKTIRGIVSRWAPPKGVHPSCVGLHGNRARQGLG